VKWANEAIEDPSLRAAIDAEIASMATVSRPNPIAEGFVAGGDIAKRAPICWVRQKHW
jgi:hypothetical protein